MTLMTMTPHPNCMTQATTISPWVVPMAALEPFACPAPKQEPAPLPYLTEESRVAYDVALQALVVPRGGEARHVVTTSNMKHLCVMCAAELCAECCILGSGTGRCRRWWRTTPWVAATCNRAICWEPEPSAER